MKYTVKLELYFDIDAPTNREALRAAIGRWSRCYSEEGRPEDLPDAVVWTEPQELPAARGIAGDRCEVGNRCGRTGCPECQQ